MLRLEKVGPCEGYTEAKAVAVAISLRVQSIKAHIGTHKTKTRSEVRGTGKKMYKQKGTGNARHSDRGAPQFRSGGVAHGPVVSHRRVKLNKKAASAVRRSLLAQVSHLGNLYLLHGAQDDMVPSTKAFLGAINAEGIKHAVVVTDNDALKRSARNVPNIDLCGGGVADPATVIKRRIVIVDAAVYDLFRQRCLPIEGNQTSEVAA